MSGIGEWVSIEEVTPWEGNPRVHPHSAVSKVAASIKRFGFVAPICVWTSRGELVAGHNRLKAIRLLLSNDPEFVPQGAPGPGLVPVRFHEFGSETDAHAYAVADNRVAEESTWDDDALKAIFAELEGTDIIPDLGFDEDELDKLIAEADGVVDGDGAWVPLPPIDPDEGTALKPHKTLTVRVRSEEDYQALLLALGLTLGSGGDEAWFPSEAADPEDNG